MVKANCVPEAPNHSGPESENKSNMTTVIRRALV